MSKFKCESTGGLDVLLYSCTQFVNINNRQYGGENVKKYSHQRNKEFTYLILLRW